VHHPSLGQQQARHLGEWWKRIGLSPTAAFAGTLERQQHTAQLALEHANLESISVGTLPELNEYAHQDVDRKFGEGFASASTMELTLADYHGIMQRWSNAPEDKLTDVESWENFMGRGLSAMHQAHQAVGPDGHALMFTSGGVIATLLGKIQSHPFSVIIDNIWYVRNASLSSIHFDDNTARLMDFNRVSHLDTHNNSDLITLI